MSWLVSESERSVVQAPSESDFKNYTCCFRARRSAFKRIEHGQTMLGRQWQTTQYNPCQASTQKHFDFIGIVQLSKTRSTSVCAPHDIMVLPTSHQCERCSLINTPQTPFFVQLSYAVQWTSKALLVPTCLDLCEGEGRCIYHYRFLQYWRINVATRH